MTPTKSAWCWVKPWLLLMQAASAVLQARPDPRVWAAAIPGLLAPCLLSLDPPVLLAGLLVLLVVLA